MKPVKRRIKEPSYLNRVNRVKKVADGKAPTTRGLITKEMFDYMCDMTYFDAQSPSKALLRYRKDTGYLPFNAINFEVGPLCPTAQFAQGDVHISEYDKKYHQTSWKFDKEYHDFIIKCIKREEYYLLLTTSVHDGDCLNMKETLKARFWQFIIASYAPRELPLVPSYQSKSIPSVIKDVKYSPVWQSSSIIKATSGSGFISNLYFLAEVSLRGQKVCYGNTTVLMSLMVRSEHMPIVRAHFASNTPIPIEYLELWVDNSLMEENHQMCAPITKAIITPLLSAGVKLVRFDDLRGEMFVGLVRPPGKSEGAWEDEMLGKFYQWSAGELTRDPLYSWVGDSDAILNDLSIAGLF